MANGLQMFLTFGGSTLIACLVTLVFNTLVNGGKKKIKEAKVREENLNSNIEELNSTMKEVVQRENKFDDFLETATESNELIRESIQSLLRHELYDLYFKCMKKGFVRDDELKDWINMYDKYHKLGKNGVMDRYNDDVIKLPIDKKVSKSERK